MADLSLVIRLGYLANIDFYAEHRKLIENNGYADVCVFTKRRPNMNKYNNVLFIKEAKKAGDRLFKAIITEVKDNGEVYPQYYKNYNMAQQTWLRISSLEVIEMHDFNVKYTTISGKELQSVFRSSTTSFGVVEKLVIGE